MSKMITHATTAELWEMFDLISMSDHENKAQATYLFEIVEELQTRGEIVEASKEEKQVVIETAKRRAAQDEKSSQAKSRLMADINVIQDGKKRMHRTLRTVSLSAASVVLLIMLSGTIANASGFDFFGMLSRWTKETLQVIRSGNPMVMAAGENSPEYDEFRAKLNEMDIVVGLPTWLPEGYSFRGLEQGSVKPLTVTAWFAKEAQQFSIRIFETTQTLDGALIETEIHEEPDTYTSNGRTYIILTNNDRVQATWIDGSYELTIQGQLTKEQLIKIINSI